MTPEIIHQVWHSYFFDKLIIFCIFLEAFHLGHKFMSHALSNAVSQIFAEKPAVRRAYLNLVPKKVKYNYICPTA